MDVLERHVDVAADMSARGDAGDEFIAPMRGVRVEQPNPELAFDLVEFAQQPVKRRPARGIHLLARPGLFLPLIHAEVGGVLADEIDLLHALGDQPADFGHDGFDGAGAMPPAHLRDDAKAARVIAALGDLGESGVRRSEAEARRIEVRDINGLARDQIERLPAVIHERFAALQRRRRGAGRVAREHLVDDRRPHRPLDPVR